MRIHYMSFTLLLIIILSSCTQPHVVKNFSAVEELTDVYCRQQAPDDKDDCFKTLSIREGNIESCNPISSQKTKAECQFEVAKAVQDPKLCNLIIPYSIKVQCKDAFP